MSERKEKDKWVKDYKRICKNCEYCILSPNEKEGKNHTHWYCELDEEHMKRVSADKKGCKHFELDYELDAKSAHIFKKGLSVPL